MKPECRFHETGDFHENNAASRHCDALKVLEIIGI
mgnify:CR=1 FL=1